MKLLGYFLGFISMLSLVIFDSCSSGKKAYEHGNYYEAVMSSVSRLRRNTDHKKSVETLQQSYPLAVAYYEDQAKQAIASANEFKWTSVVQSYTMINTMYDEIKRSPGALAVVPNPVNYYAKLDEAKKNAAEENYQAGILALSTSNREKAKQAYGLFKKANDFVVGYKDVTKMMEAALMAATVKVMITPIPATRNVAWSAEFFDDKVSEFLHGTPVNEFVKFYTAAEVQTLKINPDHVIELTFDEFVVGQVELHEKQLMLEKDSVVVATYITPGSQNVAGSNVTTTTPVNTGSGSQNTTNNPSNSSGQNNQTTTGGTTGSQTGTGSQNNQNTSGSQTQTGTGNQGNQNSGSQNQTNSGTQGGQTNSGSQGSTGNQNQGNSGNQGGQNNPGGQGNAGNQGGQNNSGSQGNSGNQNQQEEEKVTLCHKPPGNTENAQTLIVPRSAVQAHLDHGDVLGYCEDSKNNAKPEEKKNEEKKNEEKKNDDKKGNNKFGSSMLKYDAQSLVASADDRTWLLNSESDTTKVYAKVKATYYHFQKTTTSRGVVSFRIVDAKTKAVLNAEKMPGQYVWISEWATFNGDERALTPLQLEITKQREKVPPPVQDLFIEFTKPIYTQITTKIQNFYKNY